MAPAGGLHIPGRIQAAAVGRERARGAQQPHRRAGRQRRWQGAHPVLLMLRTVSVTCNLLEPFSSRTTDTKS